MQALHQSSATTMVISEIGDHKTSFGGTECNPFLGALVISYSNHISRKSACSVMKAHLYTKQIRMHSMQSKPKTHFSKSCKISLDRIHHRNIRDGHFHSRLARRCRARTDFRTGRRHSRWNTGITMAQTASAPTARSRITTCRPGTSA